MTRLRIVPTIEAEKTPLDPRPALTKFPRPASRFLRISVLAFLVAAIALGLLLSGCGSAECESFDLRALPRAPGPSQAEEAAAIAWALDFWGAPAEILDGWEIIYVQTNTIDGNGSTGMCDLCDRVIAVADGLSCDTWSLPHEIGHVLLGSGHVDPRW